MLVLLLVLRWWRWARWTWCSHKTLLFDLCVKFGAVIFNSEPLIIIKGCDNLRIHQHSINIVRCERNVS